MDGDKYAPIITSHFYAAVVLEYDQQRSDGKEEARPSVQPLWKGMQNQVPFRYA